MICSNSIDKCFVLAKTETPIVKRKASEALPESLRCYLSLGEIFRFFFILTSCRFRPVAMNCRSAFFSKCRLSFCLLKYSRPSCHRTSFATVTVVSIMIVFFYWLLILRTMINLIKFFDLAFLVSFSAWIPARLCLCCIAVMRSSVSFLN